MKEPNVRHFSVPYGTYLRFIWPLLIGLGGLTIVMLALGSAVT